MVRQLSPRLLIGDFGCGEAKMLEKFEDPEHLAIDSDGNVYVSDRGNDNIQKFSLNVKS